MDILYIGNAQGFDNADKTYMIPQKLANGFTRNGHNVYMFNDRDYARASNIFHSSKLARKRLNCKIIDVARKFEPDLVVLAHCKHVANETLDEIRTHLKDVRIVYRNVDPLHADANVHDIRMRLPAVDGVFVTTAGKALDRFSNNRSFVAFMPNPVDASIETGRAFGGGGDYDVFFAGGEMRHAHDHRRDTLETLTQRLPDARLNFSYHCLFGKDYIRMLGKSRIGLNLNKTDDYYLYSSDRMAQYLGNGMLVFTAKSCGFQDLFADDEMGFFDNIDDLADKIRFYLDHDDARRRAAAKGWEKAHRIFDTANVTQYIIEKTFQKPFSRDYGWPTESR
jgi:hypothetical protein